MLFSLFPFFHSFIIFFFFSPRVGFTPSRIQARVDTSPSIYGQIRGNVGHGTQRQYWRVHDLRETKSRCLNANFRGGRCITNALEGMKVTSDKPEESRSWIGCSGSGGKYARRLFTTFIYNHDHHPVKLETRDFHAATCFRVNVATCNVAIPEVVRKTR